MGNKHDKLAKWKEILLSKKLPSSFEVWSNMNKAKLNDLWKMEIKLEDTAFGCQATIKKIKLNAAIITMSINKLNEIESKIKKSKAIESQKLRGSGNKCRSQWSLIGKVVCHNILKFNNTNTDTNMS